MHDIIIAVIGKSGSGKSRFISRLSARKYAGVNDHDLKDVPFHLRGVKCVTEGTKVLMLDTPGFNDDANNNLFILQCIDQWLREHYDENKTLFGLICMYDIKEMPVGLVSIDCFARIRQLVGKGNMGKTIVLTTKWDTLDTYHLDGEALEARLHEKSYLWRGMLLSGATTMRHDDTVESAERVISTLFEKQLAAAPSRMKLYTLSKELHNSIPRGRESKYRKNLYIQREV
ncbi:hypothetical protein Daesc_004904 [Daldinia eschscholtzii]|uniref:G domain-containing protein n=1 Tax=Daldinia eschscholtzii TaxID=292717 RepID=A0AAX6MJF2_9PEZI